MAEVLDALVQIVSAPFRDASVLWMLGPLLLMWILLEVYFVRWHERLGWNSGLANAVTLFWVSVTSMQVVFATVFSWSKFTVFLVGIVYALLLAFVMFKHAVSERFAFLMASPLLIHFLCMMFILWAHSLVDLSWFVFVAIVVLFLVFVLLDMVLKFLVREERVAEGSFRKAYNEKIGINKFN